MTRRVQDTILLLLAGAALLATINVGCEYLPESSFQLAKESRMPRWIVLPPGRTPADVSVGMDYYIKPWGRSAGFFLRDKDGRTLKKQYGEMRCRAPYQLETPPQGFPEGYPSYEAITVNGITEIIEHRRMEPIFYVTDDATVWKQYREVGC